MGEEVKNEGKILNLSGEKPCIEELLKLVVNQELPREKLSATEINISMASPDNYLSSGKQLLNKVVNKDTKLKNIVSENKVCQSVRRMPPLRASISNDSIFEGFNGQREVLID